MVLKVKVQYKREIQGKHRFIKDSTIHWFYSIFYNLLAF